MMAAWLYNAEWACKLQRLHTQWCTVGWAIGIVSQGIKEKGDTKTIKNKE